MQRVLRLLSQLNMANVLAFLLIIATIVVAIIWPSNVRPDLPFLLLAAAAVLAYMGHEG